MGMKDRFKKTTSKLKLDSHHLIERFGVVVAVMSVALVGILGASLGYSIEKNRKQLGSQAIYTTHFTTSKTAVKGDVVGVYTNEKKTHAMLLLKFDDVAKVSTQSKEYQSFLTATSIDMKKEALKSSPAGGIYVFGNTGYMAIYLVDADGFPSQVMNLTVRAKSELVTPQSMSSSGKQPDDGSFAKYDQFRVYFNPGASGATKLKSLDREVPDVREVYNETVVVPEEAKIREQLDEQLKKMQTDLAAINDYTKRLSTTTVGTSGVKVIAPGAMNPSRVPDLIAGDEVIGKEAVGETPSTLELKSKKVLSGGYNFDWRSGSVGKGYIDDLLPEGMDYITFLSKQGAAPSSSIDISKIDWTMTDGQLLANVDGSNPVYKPVNTIVQQLSTAYTTYFNDKKTYECDQLPKLLNLEVALRDVEANHNINTEKNAVLVY